MGNLGNWKTDFAKKFQDTVEVISVDSVWFTKEWTLITKLAMNFFKIHLII